MNTRDQDILRIASAADEMGERRTGNAVTYIKNQNLHVTNICKNLIMERMVSDLGRILKERTILYGLV